MSVVIKGKTLQTGAVPPRMLNINEASKACGLSPSVLRIWELRYGWPNPKRKANGYRSYSPHLVEDLKRMAELVRSGIPIRQLIVDGLPRWPAEAEGAAAKPRTIDFTRSLPSPSGRAETRLQKEVLDALETRRAGVLMELIQRCQWQIRPQEEAATCLAPMVVGVAELRELERGLGPHEQRLLQAIAARARQLLRRYRSDGASLSVVPVRDEDTPLATVSALILNQRGVATRVGAVGESVQEGKVLIAGEGGDAPEGERRIVALQSEGAISLKELLDPEHDLSWVA